MQTVTGKRWVGILLASFGFLALAGCSSGGSPASSGRQVHVQDCVEDFYSLRAALGAYKAHFGSFPAVADRWSAATYQRNFGPLLAHRGGGPFLGSAPDPAHYVVEFDSSGNVWVEPAGVYDTSVNRAHASQQACASVIP